MGKVRARVAFAVIASAFLLATVAPAGANAMGASVNFRAAAARSR